MKNWLKVLKSPEMLTNLAMFAFVAVMALVPEFAMAGRADIKGIVSDNIFKDVITLAFGIFAFVKWIDYAANFSPDGALRNLIVPALITFLAFKWTMVLGWFNIA